MNPLPGNGGIPSNPLFVNGSLEVIMLVSVAALLVILGMMLWMAFGTGKRRERLVCPARLRGARVLMRIAPNGRPTDVIRCSIFGRRPITCGKVCLHQRPA